MFSLYEPNVGNWIILKINVFCVIERCAGFYHVVSGRYVTLWEYFLQAVVFIVSIGLWLLVWHLYSFKLNLHARENTYLVNNQYLMFIIYLQNLYKWTVDLYVWLGRIETKVGSYHTDRNNKHGIFFPCHFLPCGRRISTFRSYKLLSEHTLCISSRRAWPTLQKAIDIVCGQYSVRMADDNDC